MMPFRLKQPSPAVQRGKKASIQQLHDDEEGQEALHGTMRNPDHPFYQKGDHQEETTGSPTVMDANAMGPTSHSTTSTAAGQRTSHRPRHHRWRWVVERMISHPILSVFVCDGSTGRSSPSSTSLSLSPSSSRSNHYQQQHHQQQYWKSTLQTQAPHFIVQTMKQFPYQGRIQRMGCSALRDLAKDSWPMKQCIVEQVQGVECLLKAMRNHAKDAIVQELALHCLYELVAGNLPEQLVEKGVVGMVLSTMEGHVEDEDVVVMACNVLLALTDHGPGSVECLRHKLGGVILAKLEYSFRGRNGEISKKASELLRRLYL